MAGLIECSSHVLKTEVLLKFSADKSYLHLPPPYSADGLLVPHHGDFEEFARQRANGSWECLTPQYYSGWVSGKPLDTVSRITHLYAAKWHLANASTLV
jgi:hypothetical protein